MGTRTQTRVRERKSPLRCVYLLTVSAARMSNYAELIFPSPECDECLRENERTLQESFIYVYFGSMEPRAIWASRGKFDVDVFLLFLWMCVSVLV